MENNLPNKPVEEALGDASLRPTHWEEYVGQDTIKTNLQLIINAAKERGESCDHLLLYGQPGLGKTTLAYLIGIHMGSHVRSTSGPALEKTGDVAALLSNIEPYEILFIDEAHRINKQVEEVLYPAMESRKLHLIVGKGPAARTFSLDLPPFTIVAATTRINLLSAPLRSRFGATFRLDYYTERDLEKIIARSATILGVTITDDACATLARVARFTPRIANRLLRRSRDYAQVHRTAGIDSDVIAHTLRLLDIDPLGLEQTDRELITTIITKFNGGPVGLKALGASLNEDVGTIEDVYEPFLIKLGFLRRTSTGRTATTHAYEHFGYTPKNPLV